MNVSYEYVDSKMIFTNDRKEVINLIQTGEWDCTLCPQMFGSESGCYGLFSTNKLTKRTKEEAESWLSGIERSGRKAFSNEPFNPADLPEGIPDYLLPGKM